MATENIVTGKKYRILKDATNKIWDVMSFWGKAKDVEFDDGKNAETKLGNIQGITSSLASDSSSIAASANAVKQLNDKITKLNSDIKGELKLVSNQHFLVAWNGTTNKTLTADYTATNNCDYIIVLGAVVDDSDGAAHYTYNFSASGKQINTGMNSDVLRIYQGTANKGERITASVQAANRDSFIDLVLAMYVIE